PAFVPRIVSTGRIHGQQRQQQKAPEAPQKAPPSQKAAPAPAAATPPPARQLDEKDKGAPTRYGREELHVAGDVSSRYEKKRRTEARRTCPGQEGRHAFEMPTAPVVREVSIGETVTVSELAQKMAVKANEVIKVLMNIGVMATINQPLDRDTAVLVVEEMGHTPKVLKENQIEEDLQGAAGDPDHGQAEPPAPLVPRL